ncbi:melanoma-associated antigen B4-like [Myotis daubentonii]|uniref:melanoma-associated antigen B4-like n=1 Tax=Myotis daubentonii TaxID=98922 RepID=UPI002872D1F5|nr:melanoma-associated antigen B4-like [Myotis daubentonii]XP_059534725.1 melanoma-associated antigen B4-like [Myotis daubentonii]XP_059534727.1 melanoma-associated antigen B4-like [Myotis daubentonii]
MPRGHKSKLRAQRKHHQNRAEKQGDKSAQAAAGEEGEGICSSSSVLGDAGAGPLQAPPSAPATTSATAGASCERSAVKAKGQVQKSKKSSQASTATESSGQDLLTQKANMLVRYLLYQHKKNQPIRKGDMLKIIRKWFRKDFPEILRRASERMDRWFGLQVKEVKPSGNSYTLIDSEDESVSSGFRFPNKGILMPVLGVISLNGNSATEEMIWGFLNKMSVYDGKIHFIFGEPRKLITQDLVQEKYLLYKLVPNSDPPRYEFLWGPRAHAETSKMKVLEFFSLLNSNIHTVFAPHFEEALKEEDERAQARAQAAPRAAPPPKASGRSRAKSSL